MKNLSIKGVFCAALLAANWAFAIPTLQLDIVNGVYDSTEESTVATTPNFTLRALLKGTWSATDPYYYVSAAITPGQSLTNPTPNFGPVVIDGTTYGSAGWVYGTPPVDSLFPNLPSHGIFPTYYMEFKFTFDSLHTVAAYNVQDDSGAPGLLYYHDFSVDVTNLGADYRLHFDLYDENVKTGRKGTTYDIAFAPFSHDASSGKVPDGGATVLMLGLGLFVLAVVRRKSA